MTYFITGAAGGIGLEAARELLARGERVIAGVRGSRVAELKAALGDKLETVEVDMSSFDSIRSAAARVRELAPSLDVLINNAGVAEAKRKVAVDGHEMIWTVNVLAPYLLTELLLPSLQAAPQPRVVMVGSIGHRRATMDWDDLEFEKRRFVPFAVYCQSKLALLLLTREFARRYPGIAFNCVHPGAIATGIWRNVPTPIRIPLLWFMPGPVKGAQPLLKVAADPALAGTSGAYFEKLEQVAPSDEALKDPDASRLFELVAQETSALPV